VDVVLVAPKGSGTTLRTLFQEGRGLNSSVAVHQVSSACHPGQRVAGLSRAQQRARSTTSELTRLPTPTHRPNPCPARAQDASGKARERTFAIGAAVGSGYMYETTFQKEVFSDLVGERGVLMGAIQGLFAAQYEVLRAHGHSPSEAFNETVEEATQSLYPLIGACGGVEATRGAASLGDTTPTCQPRARSCLTCISPAIPPSRHPLRAGKNGMDWMYANCSTTAQRGALDWWKPFYKASKPVFEKLYADVASGAEARRTLEANSRPNYRKELQAELAEIAGQEMWRAGEAVRSLRPENQKK
jgi:ketol-acid reductoisomerase